MHKHFVINTDGGARGNPGPAAVGYTIVATTRTSDRDEIEKIEHGRYIGETTNNVAEYTALIDALETVKNEPGSEIEVTLACQLDSELVVKQLNGLYKVKDKNLRVLWAKIKNLEKNFKSISYKYIPRAQNKIADKLVNQVLDSVDLPSLQ